MKRVSAEWEVSTDVVLKESGVEARVKWSVDSVDVYLTPNQARRLAADLLVQAEEIQPEADEGVPAWVRCGLWVLGICVAVGPFIDGSL